MSAPGKSASANANERPTSGIREALNFLSQVKARYSAEPEVYNAFLDILKDFKIHEISQKMVILKVNELFVLETALLATFQSFLPKGDQEEILPGDDLSGLDSLALSAVFMSSTISQDETSGKSGSEMQILEDFFQVMRSAKKMNQPPEDAKMLFRDEDSDDDDSENDGPIEIQPASHEITPQDGATKLDLAVSALSRTLAQPADQRKKPPPVPPGAEGQGKKPALTLLDTDEDKPANTAKPVVQEKPTPSSGESSDSDDHSVASSKTGIVDELASDGGSQSGQHDEALEEIFPMRGRRTVPGLSTDATDLRSNWDLDARELAPNSDDSEQPRDNPSPIHKLLEQAISNDKPDQNASQEDDASFSGISEVTDTINAFKAEVTAHLEHISKTEADPKALREDFLQCLKQSSDLISRLYAELSREDILSKTSVLILYRVYCPTERMTTTSTDLPSYSGKRVSRHLRGSLTVGDMDEYIERQSSYSFLVFRDYVCDCSYGERVHPLGEDSDHHENGELPASKEYIKIASEKLCQELNALVKELPRSKGRFPVFDIKNELQSPYFFYYHNRQYFIDQANEELASPEVKLLLGHIEQYNASSYDKVDSLFTQGLVSEISLPYLFDPMAVLVTCIRGEYCAYQQRTSTLSDLYGDPKEKEYMLPVERWVYDGTFEVMETNLFVKFLPKESGSKTMKIEDLKAYPLKFAKDGTEDLLRERGKIFWSCRNQKYALYSGPDYSQEMLFSEARFMIDISAYKKMHPEKRKASEPKPVRRTLEEALANADDPPEGDFLLLLPPNIYGFNMQEKKWINLQVGLIRDMIWNRDSFESLVIEPETKELIVALITNKLEAERATDLVAGKGNGLIILLHGGPGTGKTLTAESVAEIAEKPLYRVTCGDIGTSSEDVEKYLETVLTLGKMWKSVVLLDEADVFLEQRSLADLHRNALVSVFLRVLEYYDGILILTSNRVGTFDEAFKSRIQLSLHYEALSRRQRKQIWQNFIARLERSSIEADFVDTANLYKHVDELAGLEMNGREIRNALTTARQLALHKKQKMDFGHLKHVVKVAGKFERYLQDISEGVTDEDMARARGLR